MKPIKLTKRFFVNTVLFLIPVIILNSCNEERIDGGTFYIKSFELKKENNSQLDKDYKATIDHREKSITFNIGFELSNFTLIPNIHLSPDFTVEPVSGKPVDFTMPVNYTVTNRNGDKSVYRVIVNTTSKSPLFSALKINDNLCPFDRADQMWFYTVNTGENRKYKVECAGRNITFLEINGVKINNGDSLPEGILKSGNTLTVVPRNESGIAGSNIRLGISSLPLVKINVAKAIADEPKTECFISVIDPLGRNNNKRVFFAPHRAGIEIRGGLSKTFPKKSYGVEFWQSNSNEEVESGTELLGLRDDGDWILDAMYVDRGRMRNRLNFDVWLEMNKVPYLAREPKARNGIRGFFVELFINDSYAGLYCLNEKVDRNQLNLNVSEGFSYKASFWSFSTEFINSNAGFSNNSETWDGWELEYQGLNYIGNQRWEMLRNFIAFTSSSADAEFIKNIDSKIDLDNIIDYLLFTNAIGADDNTGKNTFFSVYSNGYPKFFITPWDLDASWGRKWNGNYIDLKADEFVGVTGTSRTDSRYCRPNAFFQRLMDKNPAQFRQRIKFRWKELRAGEFSPANLTFRINTYRNLLESSGAYSREMKKWPATTVALSSETDFMIKWMDNRLKQLDDYIEKL